MTVPVGNKPEIDPDAAVIENLPAATYRLQIEAIPGTLVLTLDGVSTAKVDMREVLVQPIVEQGHIRGRVENAPFAPLRLLLLMGDAIVAETSTDENGAFVFDALTAGRYVVHVPALDLHSEEVVLGGNAPWDGRRRNDDRPAWQLYV